jgi:hypothetical protein
MPAFDGVKLSFAGMTYPSTETTKVSNDGNTAVKLSTVVQNGPVSLDILGMNKTSGNFTTIGKSSSRSDVLATSADGSLSGLEQNNEFVVSALNGKVAESHVYKVGSFSNTTSNGVQVVLTPQDGGSQITLTNGQATSIGTETGITLTPTINYTAKTVDLAAGGTGATFGYLYTKDGLTIALPLSSVVNNTNYTATATGVSSYTLAFKESTKDGNINQGNSFSLTLAKAGSADNYQTSVTGVTNAGDSVEQGDTNVYSYVVPSNLATAISYDQGPTQETATITYNGGESYGKLYLASPSATVSNGASSLGNIIYKDSEVANISAGNVIVVGGSCINSAAATVLGVADHTCGDAFTQATGVGAGQYLIEGFANSALNGKYALVVAGYSAADTTNAASYLTMKNPDLANKWTGTTATEATVVTQ